MRRDISNGPHKLPYNREREGRVRDRIKAVFLCAEGWTQKQIAQALRIRYETVQDHLEDFKNSKAPMWNKLLVCGLPGSGMTKWLTRNNFSYKKAKGTPAKADPGKQAAFIKYYEDLLNTLPGDEPIEFADASHLTMATKITYGWIRKGQDKLIATTASRTRVNLLGSINLETIDVTINSYETIDSKAMEKYFATLRKNIQRHHQILDNGPYNISHETKQAAEKYKIVLHYLPPYSPNLNLIERLWKVTNEFTRNIKVFKAATDFKKAINDFFLTTWPEISRSMVDRINDNFQVCNKVPSS